jgi:hypothetical protein
MRSVVAVSLMLGCADAALREQRDGRDGITDSV